MLEFFFISQYVIMAVIKTAAIIHQLITLILYGLTYLCFFLLYDAVTR